MLLKPCKVEWLQGEVLLNTYKVPDAKRFHTVFCNRCGSGLPAEFKELDSATIPAGTLDEAPPLVPQSRIFMDSAADWSCHGDEIPALGTYPGR